MRDWPVRLLFLMALVLLAAFAWLTRHPDAEILARAAEMRVIGPAAAKFRKIYLPAPPPAAGEDAGQVEIVVVESPALRAEEPDELIGARPVVWVEPGAVLRSTPDAGAAEVAIVPGIANLRVFERRGDWFDVRYRQNRGWVLLEGYEEDTGPIMGSAPLAPGPLPARRPDEERLAEVRRRLGVAETPGRLGAYDLYTDVEDRALLGFLERAIAPLETLYRERYGLTPIGRAGGAVALFGSHRDFAAYQRRLEWLVSVTATGVAGHGIVALDCENRTREALAATLIHEVTHLLNRRALGPALPAWLEEGLADDLAHSEIDESGEISTERLGGVAIDRWDGWEWRGALASAIELRRALDAESLQSLEALVALEWREFVAGEADQINYAQAGFWVRYLLTAASADRARGFRDYLAGIAAGGAVAPEELSRRLGAGWDELDTEFHRWIRFRFHEPVGTRQDTG